MKKFFSVFLSLAVIISTFCFASTVFAQSEDIVESNAFIVSFDSDTGVLTVNGRDAMYFYMENSIQDYFEDADGKSIDDVKKIVVCDGITVIDSDAFRDMKKAEEILLPSSLVKINSNAFKNCRKLKKINYEGSRDDWKEVAVSTVGNSIFLRAAVNFNADVPGSEGEFYNTFKKFEHNDSVYDFRTAVLTIKQKGPLDDTRIDQTWFGAGDAVNYRTITIEGVDIKNGVNRIGSDVFAGCTGIEYVKIPKSVTRINKSAFYGCENLKDVYFDGSKSQWKKIAIESEGNDEFLEATMHYAIEEETSYVPMALALLVLVLYAVIFTMVITRRKRKNMNAKNEE